ncbi:MAG: hypothetical protein KJ607_04360 [Bacteroidetes bacterium]|nr:hypothetical protein [Bacteroidota bacterium]
MKTLLFCCIAFLTAGTLIFLSCNKNEEEEQTPDTDVQAVIDNVKSEEAVTSTFNTVNHYGINEEGIKSLQSDSVVITVDPCVLCDSFPKTMTIDYGATGLLINGKLYKGKIIAVFNGRWGRDVVADGTYADVTYDGFAVDNVTRSGQARLTYNGGYPDQPSFTTQATNLVLTLEDNETQISLDGSRTVTWTSGFGNESNTDDVFEITGTVNGVDRNGVAYESKIDSSNPLVRDMTCTNTFTFVSGKLEITPAGKVTRIIDFGDGGCDNTFTVNINGWQNTYQGGS